MDYEKELAKTEVDRIDVIKLLLELRDGRTQYERDMLYLKLRIRLFEFNIRAFDLLKLMEKDLLNDDLQREEA